MSELLKKLTESAGGAKNPELITRAFEMAKRAHDGQKRLSGEDYITHPLHVAIFLSNLGLDATTIAAGLLHDVLEDTQITLDDLKKEFGDETAFLVEGVTKLRKITDTANKDAKAHRGHFDSLKKMLFATAEDIRVVLIKLADKFHNMETLKHMAKDDQRRIAVETLEIYAPIAARLGMGRLKGQLEDLAFPFVYPKEYSWLMKQVRDRYNDRLVYIDRTKPVVKKHLTDAGIPIVDLNSRAKHYFSLYQKLQRKDMENEKIHDLVAMRIIVPDITSCYEALGVIHKHYRPLPGLIKDYISLPKPNGYQSLHTTIFCEKGKIVEVQIRTSAMHDYAENGIAAHWAYSESGKKKPVTANAAEVHWVTQLKKFLEDSRGGESLANLKIDFFKNRIFAFSPKGDVKDLPEGATPIDFAYAIHTDLGHATRGAKVNGKIVSLDYSLKNGDVVDVIKGKEKKPSFDWIKIVKTGMARKSINAWIRENGQVKIEKVIEEVKKPTRKRSRFNAGIPQAVAKVVSEPLVDGQKGLLYKLARCCKPEPGVKVCGYLTLNRGVTIHCEHCANIKHADSARLMAVSWSNKTNQ